MKDRVLCQGETATLMRSPCLYLSFFGLLSGLIQWFLFFFLQYTAWILHRPKPEHWLTPGLTFLSAREPSVVSMWLSCALSEVSSSHNLSFSIIVLFWPFSFKDSKGKSLAPKLYITMFYLHSLCVFVIIKYNYLVPSTCSETCFWTLPDKGLQGRWCLFLQHINHNIFDYSIVPHQ